MSNIMKKVSQFIRDEEGTELVEWALIAGLIIVVAAGIFVTIGGNLNTIFTALSVNTQAAATATATP